MRFGLSFQPSRWEVGSELVGSSRGVTPWVFIDELVLGAWRAGLYKQVAGAMQVSVSPSASVQQHGDGGKQGESILNRDFRQKPLFGAYSLRGFPGKGDFKVDTVETYQLDFGHFGIGPAQDDLTSARPMTLS